MTLAFTAQGTTHEHYLIGEVTNGQHGDLFLIYRIAGRMAEGCILEPDKIKQNDPDHPESDAFYTVPIPAWRMALWPKSHTGHTDESRDARLNVAEYDRLRGTDYDTRKPTA